MSAQGQSSSAKRRRLAVVSSGLIFLKKKKKKEEGFLGVRKGGGDGMNMVGAILGKFRVRSRAHLAWWIVCLW